MKFIVSSLVVFIFSLGFFGSSNAGGIKNVYCGSEWINIHKKNPDLISIYIQQLPDNHDDAKAYKGKHPTMVIYFFKGNKAHQVSYTPTGQTESGFWFNFENDIWTFNNSSKEFKPDTYCAYWVKKNTANE